MNVQLWIDLLVERWKGRDPQAIAELFTEDATYHQGPYGAARVGQRAIAEHWTTTLSNQQDPVIWIGAPIASGDRAFVEWWCILHDPATGTPRTGAGSLALRFAEDGRCTSLHEYWHSAADTAREPAEGWFV